MANGRSEAEQHTFLNGKVTTAVLPAEPPAPSTSAPPEDAPARCIDTREEARRVVEVLMRHITPDRVHAVDTEVMGLDLSKSPLGQGWWFTLVVAVYNCLDLVARLHLRRLQQVRRLARRRRSGRQQRRRLGS